METVDQASEVNQPATYQWVMFSMLALVLVGLNVAIIFSLSEQARVKRESTQQLEIKVRQGAALFISNCATCHGQDGKGSEQAPALNAKNFLSSVSDDFLRHTIAEGRPRTIMPAWGQAEGGPFTMQEIDQLVAFIRNWEKPAVEVGRTKTASGLPADSIEGGQETFIWFCGQCHGEDGKLPAGTQGIIANSPERLSVLTESDLRQRILYGGDEMPGMESLLSPAEVDGLIKFINTWPR
jgi:ubiquinol-cytochrome c reductase cytochrome c subunit